MFEKWDERKIGFKKPRPDNQGNQNFRASWWFIIFSQMNFPHDKQHDWNPKWNANHVVEGISGEIIWKIWFENPAIRKIQNQTEQK
jgi:hypothetical protein